MVVLTVRIRQHDLGLLGHLLNRRFRDWRICGQYRLLIIVVILAHGSLLLILLLYYALLILLSLVNVGGTGRGLGHHLTDRNLPSLYLDRTA